MTTGRIPRKGAGRTGAECVHCEGTGWVEEQVETSFGEFEDVYYVCHMCFGTRRQMTRKERRAYREMLGRS